MEVSRGYFEMSTYDDAPSHNAGRGRTDVYLETPTLDDTPSHNADVNCVARGRGGGIETVAMQLCDSGICVGTLRRAPGPGVPEAGSDEN